MDHLFNLGSDKGSEGRATTNSAGSEPALTASSTGTHGHHVLSDRISSMMGLSDTQQAQKHEELSTKHEPVGSSGGLLDKVSSALGQIDAKQPAVPSTSSPALHSTGASEQLIDKLTGVFHQYHEHQDPGGATIVSPLQQPAEHQQHSRFMDKISEKFESDEVRKKRLEAEEAERRRSELEAEKARHHHHGFMDKIGEAFEGEEAKKARLEAEEAERKRLELEAEKARHQHHGLMNKISEAFEGEEVRKKRLEAEEAQRKRLELEAEKARHHHLPLDMFSKLGLGNEPVNAAPTKANEESLLDKLGSQMHLSGDSATQALLKEETLAEKIESSLHHKRPEDKVHHGGGISDKIQSALGGGSKAEESEDDLDKAIDFVQHHILRQGTQSHETILEQMKDEQIARTIRAQYKSLTGREFPMKKGEKHWH